MFYLFEWFRSFLPLHNPIGFGAVDFIELEIAVALVVFALLARRVPEWAQALGERTGWAMLLLFTLPIVLRLLLLRVHPIPSPAVSDDFSYILLGDTLAHFRLANPPHPMHRFFETYYVLQEPSYSSIYPVGQGIVLAIGELMFRNAWAGVAISVGAMCALSYWMLRGWTTPAWSIAGGLLCVIEFGPLSHWMNSYWGGAVSACAGCLAFGALPRLREHPTYFRAGLLGCGVGLEMLSRPFESVFLVLAALLFFVPILREPAELRRVLRVAPAAIAVVFLAGGVILLHDRRVTGHALELPYALSREQYGIPTTLTVQPLPIPRLELTAQQQLAYRIQSFVHGPGMDTARSYVARFFSRAGFYRFFFLPPLYLALPFFFLQIRQFRYLWILLTAILFALGTNFYPYSYAHYIAGLTCLFLLASVMSLERLNRFSPKAAGLLLLFCFLQFAFWYSLHFGRNEAIWNYESWDTINYGDADGRLAVQQELLKTDGKQLIFVRYRPQHTITEWVFNSADIDASKVVWARDLGLVEDEHLRSYYPDRKAWILEADARPPTLSRYEPAKAAPAPVVTPPPARLKFEDVK